MKRILSLRKYVYFYGILFSVQKYETTTYDLYRHIKTSHEVAPTTSAQRIPQTAN